MFDIDISLNQNNRYDLSLSEDNLGDLKMDETVKTPFLISLYTNKRLPFSHSSTYQKITPNILLSRGGYWANSIKRVEQGSILWGFEKSRDDGHLEELKKELKSCVEWFADLKRIDFIKDNDKIGIYFYIKVQEQEAEFEEFF